MTDLTDREQVIFRAAMRMGEFLEGKEPGAQPPIEIDLIMITLGVKMWETISESERPPFEKVMSLAEQFGVEIKIVD